MVAGGVRSPGGTQVRPLGPHVPGYGPPDAEIMFVGEAPGREEESRRQPFVGKTGQELRKLCSIAGIDIRDCYLTNVVKHRPSTGQKKGNNPPSREDVERDTPELVAEIEAVRPDVIVAVGLFAARWLTGDRELTMDETHGYVLPCANFRAVDGYESAFIPDEECTPEKLISVHHFSCMVCYHPAAGFHNPELSQHVWEDFRLLGKFIVGETLLEMEIDQHPDPDYYEARSPGQVVLVRNMPVAIDTEGVKGRAWGLSMSQMAGSAVVVR